MASSTFYLPGRSLIGITQHHHPSPSHLLLHGPSHALGKPSPMRGRRKRHASSRFTAAHASLSSPSPPSPSFLRFPRKENVPGDFYVDHTCIDCDTCRWMAPEVFSEAGGMSKVHRQPQTEGERTRALQALLSCPTSSICTHTSPPEITEVHETFPLAVSRDLPGVYHCGFHSERLFGATPYYVQIPGCNILVDSPRFNEVLARRLEALGGVDLMFLTHRDDVAGHERWAERFKCPRIIHKEEIRGGSSLGEVEVKLEGSGPWTLCFPENRDINSKNSSSSIIINGNTSRTNSKTDTITSNQADQGPSLPSEALPSLTILHTPGHTLGSCCLLLPPSPSHPQREGVLFSGDHLAWSGWSNSLSMFPGVNRGGLDLQRESVRQLADWPFLWILPGHGRRIRFEDEKQREETLRAF